MQYKEKYVQKFKNNGLSLQMFFEVGKEYPYYFDKVYENKIYKKIMAKLLIRYNVYRVNCYIAENDNYIVVCCQDYINAEKYTTGFYNLYIYDKNGNLLLSDYLYHQIHSRFFLKRIDFEGEKIRLFVRSCHNEHKQTDIYYSIWIASFDIENSVIKLKKNPFIFAERYSERGEYIENGSFEIESVKYYTFKELLEQGEKAYELSVNLPLLSEYIKNYL